MVPVMGRGGLVAALLAVASACAVPAAADAATAARGAVKLVLPGGKALPGRWQAWADASRMPTVRTRVTVRLARCPALPRAAGCVYTRRPRTIWIRPGAGDPKGALMHELGHAFDLLVMSNRDRATAKRIFGLSKRRGWWRGREPAAEWFAEGYNWCSRYARIVSLRRYATYHYRPSPAEHVRLCQLIKRIAKDHRPSAPAPSTPPVTRSDPPAPPPPSPDSGTVPGDPENDDGPTEPEDPNQPPPVPPVPALPPPPPVPPPPLPGTSSLPTSP
jgi:hypothetical protein